MADYPEEALQGGYACARLRAQGDSGSGREPGRLPRPAADHGLLPGRLEPRLHRPDGAYNEVLPEFEALGGAQLVGISIDHARCHNAAEAAEAAGAQDRFWELHDLLFENQDGLRTSDLLSYARSLGLDLDRFTADLTEHVHAPRIRQDFLSGLRSGVNGTPTFFINGVRRNGRYDVEALVEALRAEL